MYSNPGSALSEIRAILATVQRAEGNVDFDDISGELEYRAREEKRFSPSTAASASVGSMGSELKKLSFPNDMAAEFLTYWCEEGLRSLPFLPPLDEVHLARLGLEESDAEGRGEVGDGINKAWKIWIRLGDVVLGVGGSGQRGRFKERRKKSGGGTVSPEERWWGGVVCRAC